ncbi:extracellular solute-binding protein [Paenibacillus sp. HN-1]|uniref:ABC transporter substrate-binding protein n=1 Tax=Paenibacillus TaxID=44249 RepID=UPI001CA9F496|nr:MULTISPECIES: extracellular solute-binding protein [Paenibacillus]MBY9080725.1 extracellular solute-binding protein [Paenibacillus sp. CGMCC 1.18879]MBY9085283.1 extracellular solute-binding protein [Paenibacillus sinensis]
MSARTKTLFSIVALVSMLSLALMGCGNGGDNSSNQGAASAVPGASSKPGASNATTTGDDKPVTLKMLHFMEAEAGPTLKEINKRFHEKYPNITIEYENAPVDQYQTLIRTRFASGDAPDLLGVFPGTWKKPFVESGYLMDLSDRPWVSRLQEGAKEMESQDGKVYALPLDQNAIGVVYNKKIFSDLGLSIPQNWDEFLALCEKLKAEKITPLAIGNKDLWVTQLIPYAMAPSAIYRDNPAFDQEMYEGKATFADSAWTKIMQDYVMLDEKGYFNKGVLGTSYDQMVQLMATGKAGMMVMGNWALPAVLAVNPDVDLGMFPLPYAAPGEKVLVSSAIALGIGASAKTEHPEEVKKYIDFWAEPENNELLLKQAQAFPVFTDVNPDLGATLKELLPYLNAGTYSFLDQNWPQGVQETMFTGIQKVLVDGGKTYPIDNMLKDMDKVFTEKKDQ